MDLNQFAITNVITNHFKTGNLIVDMLVISVIGMMLSSFREFPYHNILRFIMKLFQKQKNRVYINDDIIIANNLHDRKLSEVCFSVNKSIYESFYKFFCENIDKISNMNQVNIEMTQQTMTNEVTLNTYYVPTGTISIDGFDIHYSSVVNQNDKNNTVQISKSMLIESYKSVAQINEFIKSVYIKYELGGTLKIQEKQHFYTLISNTNKYNKYTFKSKVTFDDIFFPKKTQFMQQIQHFMNNDRLSKFTILLHGKPGGGKTSFIKALANLNQYHIFNINLNDYTDFESLYRLFHSDNIETALSLAHIPCNKRIYVFEDIDAQSTVVLQRFKEVDKKEDKKEKKDDLLDMLKERIMDDKPKEQITLSKILNLLDGIVELQKPIIVLTTNHYDKLDKALVRPGRITWTQELEHVSVENMHNIIKKYMGTYTEDIDNLLTSLHELKVMPALIENFCIHESSITGVINNIRNYLLENNVSLVTDDYSRKLMHTISEVS